MASDTLSEFIRALRAADVPVSTAETLDAVQAVNVVGYGNRQQLKIALGSVLAKTVAHKRVHDACFDQFFNLHEDVNAADQKTKDSDDQTVSEPPQGDIGRMPAASGAGGGQRGEDPSHSDNLDELSELSQQLLQDEQAALQQALAEAASEANASQIKMITQRGLIGRRMYLAMGGESLDEDITALEQQAGYAALEQAMSLRRARDQLREQIRSYVARQFLLQGKPLGNQIREEAMRETPLRNLSEFKDVEVVVRKMARRLIALNSRRKKQAKRGVLDGRRTVMKSFATDGVPYHLVHRERRRLKPCLYVICDISNSVSAAASFLMLFLLAVSEVLPRTRLFVFASQFSEVTEALAQHPEQETIDAIMAQWAGPGTDYAGMLSDVRALVGHQINKRSTLLILGDARNNDRPAGQEILKELAQQAGSVLWLNPENRNRWDSGDSVMSAYQPYCRHVASCATLAQLERFVDYLIRDLKRS